MGLFSEPAYMKNEYAYLEEAEHCFRQRVLLEHVLDMYNVEHDGFTFHEYEPAYNHQIKNHTIHETIEISHFSKKGKVLECDMAAVGKPGERAKFSNEIYLDGKKLSSWGEERTVRKIYSELRAYIRDMDIEYQNKRKYGDFRDVYEVKQEMRARGQKFEKN